MRTAISLEQYSVLFSCLLCWPVRLEHVGVRTLNLIVSRELVPCGMRGC